MLDKFQPHEVVEIERLFARPVIWAEKLLLTGMMEGLPVTEPVSKLLDIESWHTHGQVNLG